MKIPTSSRRTFLKSTIAGASVALGDLHGLALAAEPSPAGALAGPGDERSSGAPASPSVIGYTQGVGVYPGDPGEDFAPTVVADDTSAYRNLALLRPAYHSSSYDYNLTAQLVTDGIKDSHLPNWVETSVSFTGTLPKEEREFFLDHNPTSVVDLRGSSPWAQVYLGR
jgi:hypothetical protein